MSSSPHVPLLLALGLGLLPGCDSERLAPPPAQPSSDRPATGVVRSKTAQPFTSSCLIVEPGATVEWRNLSPTTALSVVSTKAPYELSSPALRDPYNLVTPDRSDECAATGPEGCIVAVPFSFWRHTFTTPGLYDYRDGSGGMVAAVVGYGMPAGSATSSGAASGTICVREPGAPGCTHVCCTGSLPNECDVGVTCISGRCGGVSQ